MRKNLVSFAERTTDEQREIARAGGVASGKARRDRKHLRDVFEELLANNYLVSTWIDTTEFEGETIDGTTLIAFKTFVKAANGDMRAVEFIRDIVGEKPLEQLTIATAETVPESVKAEIIRSHTQAGIFELLEQLKGSCVDNVESFNT